MDVFYVTPEMERHMSCVDMAGRSDSLIPMTEEQEAQVDLFLESGADIDDSFVYEHISKVERAVAKTAVKTPKICRKVLKVKVCSKKVHSKTYEQPQYFQF